MIKTYIEVAPTGEVISVFTGDIRNFVTESTTNEIIEINEKPKVMDTHVLHYSFDEKVLKEIIRPHPSFIFDHVSSRWIDVRTLDEIKDQKWAAIKTDRDELEFGGFEFEGNIYDSDQVSQGRIMGAVIAGVDQVWTLADNTTVTLSASQLQQLYAALQAHIASAHERGRIARQLIYEAETKEQVEAINL